jgi:hypothetical protein
VNVKRKDKEGTCNEEVEGIAMKRWILGVAIMGLGASALIGGCEGQGSETPGADQPTGIEAELGVAPRSDRFGSPPSASVELHSESLRAGSGGAKDPGEVTNVSARFDPEVFRDGAAFRAKLEVK